jgi:hypothetical protein
LVGAALRDGNIYANAEFLITFLPDVHTICVKITLLATTVGGKNQHNNNK